MNFTSIISFSNESKHLENTYELLFREENLFSYYYGFYILPWWTSTSTFISSFHILSPCFFSFQQIALQR
jgi:hypothetical protein